MMKTYRTIIGACFTQALLFFLGTTCLSACSEEETASMMAAGGTQSQSTPGRLHIETDEVIEYSLRWSWEGASWDEQSQTYQFETDLGYLVGIEAAYVGSNSLELIPCESEDTQNQPLPYLRIFRGFFLPNTAHADHSFNHDDTWVVSPIVESAFQNDVKVFGYGTADSNAYCKLHYLITPLEKESEDGFVMQRWSAYVRGWFQTPNQEQQHPFEVTSSLRGGRISHLFLRPPEAFSPVGTPAGQPRQPATAFVLIERYPAKAFDGQALETLSEVELAYEFLKGLSFTSQAFIIEVPSDD